MTDFTEEQKKEIAEMIKRNTEIEQFRLAGDQFYRLAISHVSGLSNQDVCDPFVLKVGKTLYGDFLNRFFPKAEAAPEKEESADGETKQE